MKKYLSVFLLTARESLYRLVLLWTLSFILQGALTFFAVKDVISGMDIPSPLMLFKGVHFTVPIIFFITFVLTAVLLCKTGMQFSSKTGYTLRRLLVSEKTVFVIQSIYNFLMLIIYYIFSAGFYFIILSISVKQFPAELITVQTVYKTFYESGFLANLIGGTDVLRIVRNVTTLISLAVNYAAFSFLFRRGKKWIPAAVYTAACLIFMLRTEELGALETDVAFISVAVCMLWSAAAYVITRREQYD